jgi:hypothetical protein
MANSRKKPEFTVFKTARFCSDISTQICTVMKAGVIVWSLGALLATGAAYAYDANTRIAKTEFVSDEPGQYCARMRDGKMIVLFDGKEISGDVFLKNGSTVKPDGTVITKDGVRFSLKEGQCIDQNGSIIGETMKNPY